MILLKEGKIIKIIREEEDIQEVIVKIDEKEEKAINYVKFLGKCKLQDEVVLNTTAVYLKLGTGGYHFITSIKEKKYDDNLNSKGHIMKLRYTPFQIKCNTAEEKNPDVFNNFKTLNKLPVILMPIHSMLPSILVTIKEKFSKAKIAYIMTEGGALPLAFSNIVKEMKKRQLIDVCITSGNTFGGDLESINGYTSLIAAKEMAKCDIAIMGIGPGHVGTGTKYGFTGIEQGAHIDMVNTLGGTPIFIPRISFAENRTRHLGISHHSITNLKDISYSSCIVGIPKLYDDKEKIIMEQINYLELHKKHKIILEEEDTIDLLEKNNIRTFTMGRTIKEDPIFFQTAGACGSLATRYLV